MNKNIKLFMSLSAELYARNIFFNHTVFMFITFPLSILPLNGHSHISSKKEFLAATAKAHPELASADASH